MRQHGKGIFKGNQVSRVGRLVADPANQPFQIVNGVQVLCHLLPGNIIHIQLLNGILPCKDSFPVNQRLLHEGAQHPGSHGRLRLIQHPEQRPSLLLLPEGLCQLQISSGGGVKHHILPCGVRCDGSQMIEGALLGFIEIGEHGSGCDSPGLVLGKPQSVQVVYMEVLPEESPAGIIRKEPVFKGRHHHMQAVLQLLQVDTGHIKRFIADNLRRGKLEYLVEKRPLRLYLCHQIISCTDVNR